MWVVLSESLCPGLWVEKSFSSAPSKLTEGCGFATGVCLQRNRVAIGVQDSAPEQMLASGWAV